MPLLLLLLLLEVHLRVGYGLCDLQQLWLHATHTTACF